MIESFKMNMDNPQETNTKFLFLLEGSSETIRDATFKY